MALATAAVLIADIKGPRGPVGKWPEETLLGASANPETLPPGAYCPLSTAAATGMGLPTANVGALLKYEWDNAAAIQWIPGTTRGSELWEKVRSGNNWGRWKRIDRSIQTLTSSDSLDDLSDGTYTPISNSAATALGLPTPNVGPVRQETTDSGAVSQMWNPISSDPRIYVRSKISGSWTPWAKFSPSSDNGGGSAAVSSVEREMRLAAANARRGGTYGTGGLAVFCMLFDHGTNNFISKILPLLQKYNLTAALGLNSQMYSAGYQFASSDNQTSFAQLQAMALANGIPLWNHGRLHNGGGESEIVGGRNELQASLPLIPIENWLHTGAYGDFASGSSFAKYWENQIGSVIMNSHAYLTGDIQEPIKPLSGQAKPGFDGQWIDGGQTAINLVKGYIQQAQKVGGAVMTRQHPMYLDAAGYLTTAQLDAFMAWVAAERDAGRLLVLTPDLINLADADRTRRRNLLDGSGGVGDQGRLIPASMYELARGSVNEIHAKVRLATAGTVRLQVTGTGLSASKTFTVPANTWVDLRKYFTIPLTGTTDLNVTCWALSGSGLQVEALNVFPG